MNSDPSEIYLCWLNDLIGLVVNSVPIQLIITVTIKEHLQDTSMHSSCQWLNIAMETQTGSCHDIQMWKIFRNESEFVEMIHCISCCTREIKLHDTNPFWLRWNENQKWRCIHIYMNQKNQWFPYQVCIACYLHIPNKKNICDHLLISSVLDKSLSMMNVSDHEFNKSG